MRAETVCTFTKILVTWETVQGFTTNLLPDESILDALIRLLLKDFGRDPEPEILEPET